MAEAEKIVLDSTLSAEWVAYCNAHNLAVEPALDCALRAFMARGNDTLVALMAGYTQMAALNTEICAEFKASEDEVFNRIG